MFWHSAAAVIAELLVDVLQTRGYRLPRGDREAEPHGLPGIVIWVLQSNGMVRKERAAQQASFTLGHGL